MHVTDPDSHLSPHSGRSVNMLNDLCTLLILLMTIGTGNLLHNQKLMLFTLLLAEALANAFCVLDRVDERVSTSWLADEAWVRGKWKHPKPKQRVIAVPAFFQATLSPRRNWWDNTRQSVHCPWQLLQFGIWQLYVLGSTVMTYRMLCKVTTHVRK